MDYGDDWAGRYYTTEAELLTMGVNPGAGYRVNRWLSVGAGFSVLYATLDQKAAINNSAVPGQAGLADGKLELDADDVGYGFNLGVLLSPWVPSTALPNGGCGRWARPTTLRLWMTLIKTRQTCPWTGRSASAREFNTTGTKM